jgi:gluconate kinase
MSENEKPSSTEIVTTSEMMAKEPGGSKSGGFSDTTLPWIDQENRKHYIPTRWYWGSICKRILTHNKAHGFTGIVMIGMSGSGKTTLTQTLIHQIHSYGENYTVDWFNGHDMLNIDKKINAMTVGVPHIMVFDDASYTMENAKASEVGRLANALTTVRHKVKSKIIMIMNIHYSKATKKFFRNQHFTFLTSITTEELGNLKDLFQDKMPMIRQFGQKYRQMALQGRFYAPINVYKGTFAKYQINDPFRLGLVSEITDVHFFLYPRLSCKQCLPGAKDEKTELDTDTFVKKARGFKNLSALRTALRFWLVTHNHEGLGVNYLPTIYRGWWKTFDKVSIKHNVNWVDILDALSNDKDNIIKIRKKLSKRKSMMGLEEIIKGAGDEKVDKINKDLLKGGPVENLEGTKDAEDWFEDDNMDDVEPLDQVTEATDKNTPTNTPDYDSTYIPPPS